MIPQQAPRREEFKEVPCAACGCLWRRVVNGYCKYLRHRFNNQLGGPEVHTWHFCAGCGAQLTINTGEVVAADAAGAVPPEILKEVKRA